MLWVLPGKPSCVPFHRRGKLAGVLAFFKSCLHLPTEPHPIDSQVDSGPLRLFWAGGGAPISPAGTRDQAEAEEKLSPQPGHLLSPSPQPSEYENFLKFDAETRPGTIKPQTFGKRCRRRTEQEGPLQSRVGSRSLSAPHPQPFLPGAFNEPFLGLWLGCSRRTQGVMLTLLFKVQLKAGFS